MSEEQAQMLKVIKEKKSMVVHELVTSLSQKNQDNLEATLNA